MFSSLFYIIFSGEKIQLVPTWSYPKKKRTCRWTGCRWLSWYEKRLTTSLWDMIIKIFHLTPWKLKFMVLHPLTSSHVDDGSPSSGNWSKNEFSIDKNFTWSQVSKLYVHIAPKGELSLATWKSSFCCPADINIVSQVIKFSKCLEDSRFEMQQAFPY